MKLIVLSLCWTLSTIWSNAQTFEFVTSVKAVKEWVECNGEVYFIGLPGTGGALYKSLGDSSSTTLIHQFSTAPSNLVSYGGKVYFFATDSLGREPWVSD